MHLIFSFRNNSAVEIKRLRRSPLAVHNYPLYFPLGPTRTDLLYYVMYNINGAIQQLSVGQVNALPRCQRNALTRFVTRIGRLAVTFANWLTRFSGAVDKQVGACLLTRRSSVNEHLVLPPCAYVFCVKSTVSYFNLMRKIGRKIGAQLTVHFFF